MEYKLLTPSQVWQDFNDSQQDLNHQVLEEYQEDGLSVRYVSFNALSAADGDVIAVCKVTKVEPSDRYILIAQNYKKSVQAEVVADLARRGYTVVVPDFSAIGEKHKTVFPESLAYGDIEKAGEHLTAVSPTAKDTCQYLYSVIVRRTITYIKDILVGNEILLMGIGGGTEVAMQVAGMDKRICGLALINGAGYREYKNLNKYGNKQELQIDQRLLCWLTGVASVAYAKHIDAPVFVAICSNSKRADIDRLSNLLGLFKENQARISITPRGGETIRAQSYQSLTMWIEDIFNKNDIPERPKIDIRASEENLYLDIIGDGSRHIKEVTAYYSYGEYDHLIRNWYEQKCEAVSKNQYLVKLDTVNDSGPIFAFCQITYKDGFSMSSFEDYIELDELQLKKTADNLSRIVYEGAAGAGGFVEESEKEIFLETGLNEQRTPLGLKGVASSSGVLVNYEIGRVAAYNNGRILQIDAYSSKEVTLGIKLLVKFGDTVDEYTTESLLKASGGAFVSQKFSANEFKNSKMMALEDWEKVKAIKISGEDIIIGKIIFI